MDNVIIAVAVCVNIALGIWIHCLYWQKSYERMQSNKLRQELADCRGTLMTWINWADVATKRTIDLDGEEAWRRNSDYVQKALGRQLASGRKAEDYLDSHINFIADLARQIRETTGQDLHETRGMCRRVRIELTRSVLHIAQIRETSHDELMHALTGLPEKGLLRSIVESGGLECHSDEQKRTVLEFLATGKIRPAYMTTPTGPS